MSNPFPAPEQRRKHTIHDLLKIKMARLMAGLPPLSQMEYIRLLRGDPNAVITY